MITPQDFVQRWGQSALREQQGAQSHFNELCALVNHKTPTQLDPGGEFFTFEEKVTKATGGRGRADVWYKDRFAWEYKGKHKDLEAAYSQLLAYRGDLGNPPLLVVCDFLEYRIYPQWPNMSGLPFVFRNEDLLQESTRRYITWLLEAPAKFQELRQADLEARERLTLKLAGNFAHLAGLMRAHVDEQGQQPWEAMQIARFLTKLVFCLFCEDVDIMPRPFDQPVFRYIITEGIRKLDDAQAQSDGFMESMTQLFQAMNGERGTFILKPTPYFNGGIFVESQPGAGDGLEVLDITQVPGAVDLVHEVSEADWRFVNPTIFGTLFEGALDISKRAQLGAHYTGESDIRLLIDPVLMQPILREWDAMRSEAEPLLQAYLTADTPRARTSAEERLKAIHAQMMQRLEQTTVLDPACGSGNFLYMALKALKDLEGRVRKFFEPLGLPFRDVVTPRQLYGIEKDEFAANLAKVVVWIGYLQWRYEDEGVLHPVLLNRTPHPRALPHPIIKDKLSPDELDRIVCDDAILRYRSISPEVPYEPEWPTVDVIIGNPPFLGGYKFWAELGKSYSDHLFALYQGRVPAAADLVTYWFEKARAQIAAGKAKRAGLLATNSIRGGANREVLKRIKETGDIFMGWSDNEWVLAGAAVRISMVGFDDGAETKRVLNNLEVQAINADLSTGTNIIQAVPLAENAKLCFRGNEKQGPFDIPASLAKEMLASVNASGLPNSNVVQPYINAKDIVQTARNMWIIDFFDRPLEEAQKYELPFAYVREHVKPERDRNNRAHRRENWWKHGEIIPNMRRAIAPLRRYIVTPAVAKHRVMVWLPSNIVPDHQLYIVAREDDYFFGVLHSYIHEYWSLRMGTSLEDRPRYTPTTTFETFPFPWAPGTEATATPQHAAISAAAKALHEERDAWLHPPDFDVYILDKKDKSKAIAERTLTHLYNALQAHREDKMAKGGTGGANGKLVKAARDFAPRLAELHDALDQAVLAAYGWGDLADRLRTPDGDDELLNRLLAENMRRAAS